MIDEAEVAKQVSLEIEQTAAQRAKDRANAARWNLDIAVFSFAVLIINLPVHALPWKRCERTLACTL